MSITLRIFRAIAGFIFVLQIIGIIPAFTNPESVDGHILALVFIKVVIGGICAAVFFGLRGPINSLYQKKNRTGQPALKTNWSL